MCCKRKRLKAQHGELCVLSNGIYGERRCPTCLCLSLYFYKHVSATNKSDKGQELDSPHQICRSKLCLWLWRQ